MSHSSLHNCSSCQHSPDNNEGDCMTCKLAELRQNIQQAKAMKEKGETDKPFRIDDDDELSISERLTDKKDSDYSILYLVIAAFATLALVIFFTKMLG